MREDLNKDNKTLPQNQEEAKKRSSFELSEEEALLTKIRNHIKKDLARFEEDKKIAIQEIGEIESHIKAAEDTGNEKEASKWRINLKKAKDILNLVEKSSPTVDPLSDEAILKELTEYRHVRHKQAEAEDRMNSGADPKAAREYLTNQAQAFDLSKKIEKLVNERAEKNPWVTTDSLYYPHTEVVKALEERAKKHPHTPEAETGELSSSQEVSTVKLSSNESNHVSEFENNVAVLPDTEKSIAPEIIASATTENPKIISELSPSTDKEPTTQKEVDRLMSTALGDNTIPLTNVNEPSTKNEVPITKESLHKEDNFTKKESEKKDSTHQPEVSLKNERANLQLPIKAENHSLGIVHPSLHESKKMQFIDKNAKKGEPALKGFSVKSRDLTKLTEKINTVGNKWWSRLQKLSLKDTFSKFAFPSIKNPLKNPKDLLSSSLAHFPMVSKPKDSLGAPIKNIIKKSFSILERKPSDFKKSPVRDKTPQNAVGSSSVIPSIIAPNKSPDTLVDNSFSPIPQNIQNNPQVLADTKYLVDKNLNVFFARKGFLNLFGPSSWMKSPDMIGTKDNPEYGMENKTVKEILEAKPVEIKNKSKNLVGIMNPTAVSNMQYLIKETEKQTGIKLILTGNIIDELTRATAINVDKISKARSLKK